MDGRKPDTITGFILWHSQREYPRIKLRALPFMHRCRIKLLGLTLLRLAFSTPCIIRGRQLTRFLMSAPRSNSINNTMMINVLDPFDILLEIQRGLHCLTGNDEKAETSKREDIVKSYSLKDELQLGLALHAFGDSFAHRRGDGKMFSTWYGHAGEPGTDNINRHQKLFIEYGTNLFRLLLGKTKHEAIEYDDLVDYLKEFCARPDNKAQIPEIRNTIQSKFGSHMTYQPEKEHTITWPRFAHDHAGINFLTLDTTLNLAHRWSGGVLRRQKDSPVFRGRARLELKSAASPFGKRKTLPSPKKVGP